MKCVFNVFMGPILACLLIGFSQGCTSKSDKEFWAADTMSVDSIKKNLKDPDSASFQYHSSWKWDTKLLATLKSKGMTSLDTSQDMFLVVERVRATNGFGASVVTFYCVSTQGQKTLFIKECATRPDTDHEAYECCSNAAMTEFVK